MARTSQGTLQNPLQYNRFVLGTLRISRIRCNGIEFLCFLRVSHKVESAISNKPTRWFCRYILDTQQYKINHEHLKLWYDRIKRKKKVLTHLPTNPVSNTTISSQISISTNSINHQLQFQNHNRIIPQRLNISFHSLRYLLCFIALQLFILPIQSWQKLVKSSHIYVHMYFEASLAIPSLFLPIPPYSSLSITKWQILVSEQKKARCYNPNLNLNGSTHNSIRFYSPPSKLLPKL